MTRYKLASLLHSVMDGDAAVYSDSILIAADRILSALEDEKKGEVIISTGRIRRKIPVGEWCKILLAGCMGQLIFRPTQGAK